MKSTKICILTTIMLMFCSLCYGARLVWNASTGTVGGYRVYYGTAPNVTKEQVPLGQAVMVEAGTNTVYLLDPLPLNPGTKYYMRVSAYNTAGESGLSNEVDYVPGDEVAPPEPTNIQAN